MQWYWLITFLILWECNLKGYLCGKLDWCNEDRVGAEFERTYNAKVQV